MSAAGTFKGSGYGNWSPGPFRKLINDDLPWVYKLTPDTLYQDHTTVRRKSLSLELNLHPDLNVVPDPKLNSTSWHRVPGLHRSAPKRTLNLGLHILNLDLNLSLNLNLNLKLKLNFTS